MSTEAIVRADSFEVTNILSEAYAVTLPARADEIPYLITPEMVDEMDTKTALLQKVMWEVYPGLTGTHTLLKEVEYSTAECDECGGEGWKDHHGDVVCQECGMVLSERPMTIPRRFSEGDHSGGDTAGYSNFTMFNDGSGAPALNTEMMGHTDEPDVQ